MTFQRKVSRIDRRSWDEVRDGWLNYLPSISISGQPPDFNISELPYIQQVVRKVPETGEYHEELPGLREAILHEGLFLLHKATNTSGATEIQIDNGILTWSLSSGYHSAFFSAKAIMSLLGISYIELNGRTVMIDVWPRPENISKSKLRKGVVQQCIPKFVRMPNLQHFQIWTLFQRALRTLNIGIWERQLINFLIQINPKYFARQRNTIHYSNNSWFHSDLHKPIISKDFGVTDTLLSDIVFIEPDSDDFSIILAFILLNFGILLVKDIASIAPRIRPEYVLLEQKLLESRHARFRKTINGFTSLTSTISQNDDSS